MASGWHKMDWNDTSLLQDHFYYLVTHKGYKTPMKAKWHNDMGGIWEVIGTTYGFDVGKEYWYSWETENPILAWMEMPDIWKEDSNDTD